MDDNRTPTEQAFELINREVPLDVVKSDAGWTFVTRGSFAERLTLARTDLENAVDSLAMHEELGETTINRRDRFETLVSYQARLPSHPTVLRSGITVADEDNSLTYRLGPPSSAFLIFLLKKLDSKNPGRQGIMLPSFRFHQRRDDVSNEALAFLCAILAGRAPTLAINSDNGGHTSADYQRLATSFLFHISYNLDWAVVQQRSLDDLIMRGRIRRVRRGSRKELDPPRRTYEADLVYHYQMGVATDSPMLEFIAYYHVAEHYFRDVFNRDLEDHVRKLITAPGFSYKRTRDIQRLTREIMKRFRIRQEEFTFSEQEALKLTLAAYVPLEDLKSALDEYDPSLAEYYAKHTVAFSSGPQVDLAGTDAMKTYDALSKRIYWTRNALVHSKEGDKARYIPFRHDPELAREIPLMRFMAEAIIVGSSKIG